MIGTIISPPTMATTPELIDDLNTYERTVPQPDISTPANVITS